eukprot:6214566-Pleurochrysis_carterae.AAC.5
MHDGGADVHGPSDFFHSPTIPRADLSQQAVGSQWSGELGGAAPGAEAVGGEGLHRVHPPDRIGDPERARPRAAKKRGVNAQRP